MPQTQSINSLDPLWKDPAEQGLAALQGVWIQTGFEASGAVDPPGDMGWQGALTTFDGNSFKVHGTSDKLLLYGNFSLDATVVPKSITWVDAIGEDRNQAPPGSYPLDGDHFVFTVDDTSMAHANEFKTRKVGPCAASFDALYPDRCRSIAATFNVINRIDRHDPPAPA